MLTVTFRKVSEDYVRSGDNQLPGHILGGTIPIIADEGWKFVKLKLT